MNAEIELEMRHFTGLEQLQEAAKICISKRLYVRSFQLRKWFGELRDGLRCAYVKHIVIVYHQAEPIDVMTRSNRDDGDFLAAYVRPKYRRNLLKMKIQKCLKKILCTVWILICCTVDKNKPQGLSEPSFE